MREYNITWRLGKMVSADSGMNPTSESSQHYRRVPVGADGCTLRHRHMSCRRVKRKKDSAARGVKYVYLDKTKKVDTVLGSP